MSLDISDPHITMAYDALAQNDPLRWFLLAYGNKPNQLNLCASGTGDLDELRAHVSPGNVYYGVFREPNNGDILCVALAIIPETVAGVRRARAHVHARATSSIFKAHHVLNVSNPEQITVETLRSTLRLPPRGTPQPPRNEVGLSAPKPTVPEPSTPPSTSSPPSKPANGLTPPSGSPTPTPSMRSHRKPPPRLSMPPSAKGAPSPHTGVPSPDPPPVPQPQLSPAATSPLAVPSPEPSPALSAPSAPSSPWLNKPEAPLPPPSPPPEQQSPRREPKSAFESDDDDSEEIDYGVRMAGPLADIANTPAPSAPSIGSIPDERSVASSVSLALTPEQKSKANGALTPAQEEAARAKGIWEAKHNGGDASMEDAPPAPPSKDAGRRAASQKTTRQPGKDDAPRALGHGMPPTDAPTTRRRAATDALSRTMADATATHRRIASQDTAHAPAPAPAPVPAPVSSRFLERATPETIEEEQRLATLASERRRRAAERAQREREEREEEEARERAFAERKERERVRRAELARLAEERRTEERRAAEEARQAQAAKAAREAQEAREREAKAAAHMRRRVRAEAGRGDKDGMELLAGFVTLELAAVWRRRYFRLSTEAWVFFRSDKDVTQPVHVIELGRVRALREWHEGYEELEAIPHSFAVELEDDAPLQCFADSAEDKEILLGLLNQAAGL